MKIAVSANEPNLDSDIDPRFGRCKYFIIIDPDTLQFEIIENAGPSAGSGAGVAAARLVAGKEIEAMLTGNCGPNAHRTLSAAGVKVITNVSGKITDAVKDYKAGKLETANQPNVDSHSGIKKGNE